MAGIFISYRRDDTAGYAGRLYEDLVRHFGDDRVFMDIDTLQPGLDFPTALDHAVGTADVVLALIGPRWLTITDAQGNRRLDDPDDFVRMEIATALARDTRVIPVLVRNASMPAAESLPDPLKPLARRHSYEISDRRWDYDVRSLVARLEPIVKRRTRIPLGGSRTAGIAATGILAVVLIGLVAALVLNRDNGGNGGDATATEVAIATSTAAPTTAPTAAPTATEAITPTVASTATTTPEPTATAPPEPSATSTSRPDPTVTATVPPTVLAGNRYTDPSGAYTITWDVPWTELAQEDIDLMLRNDVSLVGFQAVPASLYPSGLYECAQQNSADFVGSSPDATYLGEWMTADAYVVRHAITVQDSAGVWAAAPFAATLEVLCRPLSDTTYLLGFWVVPSGRHDEQAPAVISLFERIVAGG